MLTVFRIQDLKTHMHLIACRTLRAAAARPWTQMAKRSRHVAPAAAAAVTGGATLRRPRSCRAWGWISQVQSRRAQVRCLDMTCTRRMVSGFVPHLVDPQSCADSLHSGPLDCEPATALSSAQRQPICMHDMPHRRRSESSSGAAGKRGRLLMVDVKP